MTSPIGELEWAENPTPQVWDSALAILGGHPLQSSVWGEVRRQLDGVVDQRWLATQAGRPVWMARIEERKVAGVRVAGWAPKGPTGRLPAVPPEVVQGLRKSGLHLLVTDPWQVADDTHPGPRTIWIDLTVGKDVLLANLDKKWRNGVRRAAKEGVEVSQTADPADIQAFARMCDDISQTKGFHLDAGAERISALLAAGTPDAEARLFVARRDGVVLAGALIIRVGRSWHYFWGGTNRAAGDFRAGEAVQWAVIETAVDAGGLQYDLEGVDDALNPGTAAFKRKMGGQEVVLTGQQIAGLNGFGALVALGYKAAKDLRRRKDVRANP